MTSPSVADKSLAVMARLSALCFLWLFCNLAQGNANSVTRPFRLKRSISGNSFLLQQQEPIQQEEDEQSIIDEQQVEGTWPDSTNSTGDHLGDGITIPNCGMSQFSVGDMEKIVGGRPASPGQFPWSAFLRIITPGGDMLCGGSILNDHWILTAAHCVSNEQTGQYHASAIEVVAGTINRFSSESSRQSRYADCALKHPNWRGVRGGFTNDIALIRLSQPLNLNGPYVRPICLPPKQQPPFDYKGIARVAGWGLTRNQGSPSRTLQYTDVNIISDDECRQYPYPVNIVNSMACQGVDNSSPCQGDSGGGIIIRQSNRMTVFGIVSFGPGICNNGRIPNAVFSQVSHFMGWVQNTIRSYNRNPSCQSRRISLD